MSILNKLLRFFISQSHPVNVKEKYGIPVKIDFKVEYSNDGYFIITSPELPGFMTQARNKGELVEIINDAILTYFDVPKIESDYVYDRVEIQGLGTFYANEKYKIA